MQQDVGAGCTIGRHGVFGRIVADVPTPGTKTIADAHVRASICASCRAPEAIHG